MPLKIALVGVRHPEVIGGTEKYIRHLAQELRHRGHAVTILSLGLPLNVKSPLEYGPFLPAPFEASSDDGVSIEPIRVGRLRRIALAPVAWRGIPKVRRFAWGPALIPTATWYSRIVSPAIGHLIERMDVVEGFCSDLLATATLDAARRQGIPVALTPLAHRGQWGTDPSSARAFARADAVLAMLEPDAALYREMGVDSQRIHEVGVPVKPARPGGGNSLRARLGLAENVVLYLGRRDSYKGVGALLEAAMQIKADVAFVGPGPPLPSDRPSNALDIGPVSDEERDAWLDAADLLVLPSSGETFGGVVAEAWSVETPAVTSDHPALRALVAQGGGGVSVPATPQSIAEAVTLLLEDPQLRRRMGKSGHAYWSSHYTVGSVAARHEAVYRQIGVIGDREEAQREILNGPVRR